MPNAGGEPRPKAEARNERKVCLVRLCRLALTLLISHRFAHSCSPFGSC
jgi:hypothetical protein